MKGNRDQIFKSVKLKRTSGLRVSVLAFGLATISTPLLAMAQSESASATKTKIEIPSAGPIADVTPSAAAPAATSTTQSGALLQNKKFEDSYTLTDAKLRADAGSLSKISAKASLSYYGPTFGNISADKQPNPDGSVGNYSQAIKGSLSVRYRLSQDTTISAGTGISLNKPFHGLERTDLNNPFVSYDFSDRFGRLQMRNSPGLTVATIPDYTAAGEIGGLTWDNSLVYGVGGGFALSFDTSLAYWIFSRSYRPGSVKEGGDGYIGQYSISWYPGVKYNVSDAFNINTSAGFSLNNPRSAFDQTVLWNRTVSLRLGVGYAFTRDVYFAPYVQTYVTKLALDTTTINMSGVFSVL